MSEELEKNENDDGGSFLLESLATLDSVTIQPTDEGDAGDTPRAIIRPKVVHVNTSKALREIRESQRKLERRIAVLTGMVFLSIAIIAVLVQTNILDGGIEGFRRRIGLSNQQAKINCALPINRGTDPCLSKKSKIDQSWEGIERSGGQTVNHFTLSGK